MAPLSKLTLTSYRRTQPNRDPVEERRSKTLAALEQQKLVLAAALNGQEHTVTKPGWARDTDGNPQRVEKTHAVRPWFFQDAEGWVKQQKSAVRAEIAGKHCKCNHCFQHGDSAQTYIEHCVSTVYEKIMRKKADKCLILLEAGTGIEPV